MVTLTSSAVDALTGLLAETPEPDSGLRLQVIPGGCSGFEYSLSLAPAQEGDEVIEKDGARVILDRFSVPYLLGAEVDYEESFQGAGFVINNPNATGSCGCGKSFQT
jgi:iron-sulfur cluster assembly accessory protein